MASKTIFDSLSVGVRIRGVFPPEYQSILTHEALTFLAGIEREFRPQVKDLLNARKVQQAKYDAGELPSFDPATKAIREGEWVAADIPEAIADRRVEITGPVERKMIINALNCGAKMFMADFEDSLSPTWDNIIRGQINLRDAVNGTITYEDKARQKFYKLNDEKLAVLLVRPRGWHLQEAHIEIDGEPATAPLVDFSLYFFHNHETFRKNHGGYGPFFYLPKMQHSREAAVWNSVFERAQETVSAPENRIRATVLIETLPAVFQMHEILYELRNHSAGLNCGRWDYIFSFIKTVRAHPDRLIPDRNQVGMTQHFLKSYTELLIQTCHKRGVHAMGGMAAQIPIRDNQAANDKAFELVRTDKLREVKAGHDGTWGAHPGLIPLILQVFDENMPAANQLHIKREDVVVTEQDLLQLPTGFRTLEGLRLNTRVGIQYLAAWLTGSGAVPLYNLMEDAATAEISRVQNWQWIRYEAVLDGEQVTTEVSTELFQRVLDEELQRIEREVGTTKFQAGSHYKEAAKLFSKQCLAPTLDDFLTLDAYRNIVHFVPQ